MQARRLDSFYERKPRVCMTQRHRGSIAFCLLRRFFFFFSILSCLAQYGEMARERLLESSKVNLARYLEFFLNI